MSKLIEPGGAVVEPVTVKQMKSFLQIDEDYTEHDNELTEMITAARQRMERHLNVALVSRQGLILLTGLDGSARIPFSDDITGDIAITRNNEAAEPLYSEPLKFGRIQVYGLYNEPARVTYNVTSRTDAALLDCLKRLVATAFKYREDLQSEQVYKLDESALDRVESFSNNLPL